MTAADMRDMGERPPMPLAVVETVAPRAAADIAMDALTHLLSWRARDRDAFGRAQIDEYVRGLRDVADRLDDALHAAGHAALRVENPCADEEHDELAAIRAEGVA